MPNLQLSLPPRRTLWSTFVLHLLVVVIFVAWAISLQHTSACGLLGRRPVPHVTAALLPPLGTAAAANNTVYMSNCVVAYFLSILLLGAKLRVRKVAAVVICVGGVVVTAFGSRVHARHHGSGSGDADDDDAGATHQGLGYSLCVLSTATFGLYEVLCKMWVTDKAHPDKFVAGRREEGHPHQCVLLLPPHTRAAGSGTLAS